MKGKAIIPLVLGLGIGIFAVKMTVDMVKKAKGAQGDMVPVVRAKVDIGATVEINEPMLDVTYVPETLAPKLAFRDVKELIGRVSAQTIPAGSPIVPTSLAPKGTLPGLAARIKEGYRAVAVKVDEQIGVAGWVKPGSRVDVVAMLQTRTNGRQETTSRVILQNVEVLAVGQDAGTTGDTAASLTKSVTLLVKPDQVPKLHLAATKGTLRLAMRNQADDMSSVEEEGLTDNELLGVEDTPAQPKDKKPGFLAGLFGKLGKDDPDATDKTLATLMAAKYAQQAAAQQTQPTWAVEVLSGPKSYQVVFDGTGADARRVEKGARNRSEPLASAAQVPSGFPIPVVGSDGRSN